MALAPGIGKLPLECVGVVFSERVCSVALGGAVYLHRTPCEIKLRSPLTVGPHTDSRRIRRCGTVALPLRPLKRRLLWLIIA